ncbi:MAG: hypothetical protein FWD46_07335 [Cystobacterineae bacterium]|nr:hypothetical protein [Cystobacterineae bacterium]
MKLSFYTRLTGTGAGGAYLKNNTPTPLANSPSTQLKSTHNVDKFSSEVLKTLKESLKPAAPEPEPPPPKKKKKSWWKRLWGGVKKAFSGVKKAFTAVKKFLNTLGEKVGNWVSKGIGKTFGKVVGWIVRVAITGLTRGVELLLLKPLKVAWDILSHPVKVTIDSIKAIIAFCKNPLKALKDAAAWIVSKAMFEFMKGVSSIQTLLGLETAGRSLKPEEIEKLRSIYGDSIDYSQVVIKEGNLGVIGMAAKVPFVVGNTIYVPADYELDEGTLVHEMMHVWQYQNGGIDYMAKAVYAQTWGASDPFGRHTGYYYEKDVAEGKPFEKLSPEQQAALIERAVVDGVLPPEDPPKKFKINGVDYTAYVLDAWEMVKAGKGAP